MTKKYSKFINLAILVSIFFGIGFFYYSVKPSKAASCPTFRSGDMVKVKGKSAIYILDKNKNILAKRIAVEQLQDFFNELEKRDNPSVMPGKE